MVYPDLQGGTYLAGIVSRQLYTPGSDSDQEPDSAMAAAAGYVYPD